MKSHELAKLLLSKPDVDVTASLDVQSGVYDKHGDEYTSKVFGYSLIDVIQSNADTTLLFEVSGSGGDNVDVLDAVREVQLNIVSLLELREEMDNNEKQTL